MKVFCCFLKDKVWKNFSIRADVYISNKKRHVHIVFKKAFYDYDCLDKILDFISKEWGKRGFF